MFETHIKEIDKLLRFAIVTVCTSQESLVANAQQIEHYSRAFAALQTAQQTGTAEDALWCAEYTATRTALERDGSTTENAAARIVAARSAEEAVQLFRKRGGETQPPAQALLRAIAQRVAGALGPEGRHASADCDVMADLELLISRGVQ